MTQPDEDLTPSDHLAPEERDPEAPEADASEQAAPARPDDYGGEAHVRIGLEVDEADAVEQSRDAGSADDDYR